ncbi:MAG: hypothetical protein LBK41_04310 [Clostridiales bacterium]|nr:hypothetical protein [Clostridiales bacterium]
MRVRYYEPGTERFVSEDPVRSGLNWYMYCLSNSLMFCKHDSAPAETIASGSQNLAYTNGAVSAEPRGQLLPRALG